MTRINAAAITLLFLCAFTAAADEVEVVVDASGAMARPGIGGVPIAVSVREALVAVAAEAAAEEADLRIGLRLAGGDPAATGLDSCSATSLPVPGAKVAIATWGSVLDAVRPAGFRPLIMTVLAALADLEPLPGERRIVVVTSGEDECWLSPLKIAAALAASKGPPELRIVGLGLDQAVVDGFGAIPTRNTTSPRELLAALRWAVLDADTDERPTGSFTLGLTSDGDNQLQAKIEIDDLATETSQTDTIRGEATFTLPVGRYRLIAETAEGTTHEFRDLIIQEGADTALRLDVSPRPPLFIDPVPNPAVARGWAHVEVLGPAPRGAQLVFVDEGGHVVSPRWAWDPSGLWITAPLFEGELELLLIGPAVDGVRRVLARQPVSVVASEMQLKTPEEAGPGDTLTLNWSGLAGRGDFVSLAPRGGVAADTVVCIDIGSETELRFPPSTLDGEVDFIYVEGDTFTVTARASITVSGPTATLTSPETVDVGRRIEIVWEGPERDEDFVCLARVDAPDEEYTAWARVSDGNPVVFKAPASPGDYEVRYVDGENGTIWARIPIEVVNIPATIQAPATATSGLRFEVRWTGPAARGDFLSIAKPDARPDKFRDWASTTTGSPVTLAAPQRPGSYEVRYVSGSGREVLARSPIEVHP